eukprot:CAMPEP_0170614514 /NCGR_PEP_ID=MMETSP0224-20130122/24848_1 /TAXON_ID=285029 /ORGANISM="Togula jolla, Strain CCCM 725" /LENGTH=272 /DNA_ID=CAMNT_0010940191 /DNA_START=147 /DNA_END=965 /DNA_ORIENTATION=-
MILGIWLCAGRFVADGAPSCGQGDGLGRWILRSDHLSNGSWSLSCVLCSVNGPKLTGNQLSHVLRHRATLQHQKHAQGHHKAALALDAPSVDAFITVYVEARKGHAASQAIENVGKRRKIKRMRFCLAEAHRAMDRRFLRSATAISLMRDMRKSRLMIRFVVVSAKLEVRRGLLGIHRNFGHSARDILRATSIILRRAATVCGNSCCSFVDMALLRHIRRQVVMICTDSAADEMLAAEMMRQSIASDMAVLTPNPRVVLRDKAHSSRRTLVS